MSMDLVFMLNISTDDTLYSLHLALFCTETLNEVYYMETLFYFI